MDRCGGRDRRIPMGASARPRKSGRDPCSRPAIGSEVPEPEDLRSRDGVLKLRLTLRNHREGDGSIRYCYLIGGGAQAPTLRLQPGDTLVLTLENQLSDLEPTGAVPPASFHAARQSCRS